MTDEDFKALVQGIMLDLLAVCYAHNIRTVNVGALMRIMGLEADVANQYEADFVELDHRFHQLLIDKHKLPVPVMPQGSTLH